MYYECHITMKGDPEKIEAAVKDSDWIFSKIDGDPVLGEGVKCYATKMFSEARHSADEVIAITNALALRLRTQFRLNVLRAKVELVIYDTKKVSHE